MTPHACIFIVGLNAAGALNVVQGGIVALDTQGNLVNAPGIPGLPNDFCPIGYVLVKLGATAVATWTFGSNNWAGVTGVTCTFGDLVSLPGRPIVS